MPLWTNRYSSGPGAFDDRAYGLRLGIKGQVFVTGTAWGNASYDYLTVGYSSSGAPVWTNRYNGPANSNDVANAIVIDRDGSVLVTGRCVGEGGDNDYATVKYSQGGADCGSTDIAALGQ